MVGIVRKRSETSRKDEISIKSFIEMLQMTKILMKQLIDQ